MDKTNSSARPKMGIRTSNSIGLRAWVAISAFALLDVPVVHAHALGASCKWDGNRIQVEAYYDDDSPAANAKVQVLDPMGIRIAEGITNQQGRWWMDRPPPGRYQVVVDAGAGHRMEISMDVPAGAIPGIPQLSHGPTRESFVAFPWLKLLIGIGAIGAIGFSVWLTLHRRKTTPGRI